MDESNDPSIEPQRHNSEVICRLNEFVLFECWCDRVLRKSECGSRSFMSINDSTCGEWRPRELSFLAYGGDPSCVSGVPHTIVARSRRSLQKRCKSPIP